MPLKTHQDDLPAINLTPMIDIVFNLIIFFMVSTRFTEIERKVDVAVPQVADAARLPDVPRSQSINVYRDGRITLDNQPVTLSTLADRLAAARRQREDLDVVVRGDGDASFQSVASVLAACRQAGVSEMGVSVRLGAGNAGTKQR
jgi:biopolymer transport protein ExbD